MSSAAWNLPQLPSPAQLLEKLLEPPAPRRLLERTLTGPLRDFLARPGKGLRAQLVALCFELAGGRGDPPAALCLGIELLHAGSLIVDDIEDGSSERRGAPALHALIGVGPALNAGNWLYFAALQLLGDLPLPPAERLAALCHANAALAHCHEGQALDVGLHVSQVTQNELGDAWRALAERKTGGLAGLAGSLAARCAQAPERAREALESFGVRLGTALQLLDDVGSAGCEARRDKGCEDARNGRVTACWALAADLCTAEEFASLRRLAEPVERGLAEPDALLAALRGQIGSAGKAVANRQLQDAILELRRAIAPSLALDRAAALTRLLEESYG